MIQVDPNALIPDVLKKKKDPFLDSLNPPMSSNKPPVNIDIQQKKGKVDFNPDGSVTVDGTRMTKNQYESTLLTSHGNATTAPAGVMQGEQARVTYNQTVNDIKAQIAHQAVMDEIRQHISEAQGTQPFIPPQPLSPDVSPPGTSALDVGKIVGGGVGAATAGAGIGAAIGAPFGGVGALPGAAVGGIIGGLVGGIGTAATLFFTTKSSQQKQFTKSAYSEFTGATKDVSKIFNNANAGLGSARQNRAYMDNALARIDQAERELKAQSDQLFGEELSNNQDERRKILDWKNRWAMYDKQAFELALVAPNPANIDTSLAMPDEVLAQ